MRMVRQRAAEDGYAEVPAAHGHHEEGGGAHAARTLSASCSKETAIPLSSAISLIADQYFAGMARGPSAHARTAIGVIVTPLATKAA